MTAHADLAAQPWHISALPVEMLHYIIYILYTSCCPLPLKAATTRQCIVLLMLQPRDTRFTLPSLPELRLCHALCNKCHAHIIPILALLEKRIQNQTNLYHCDDQFLHGDERRLVPYIHHLSIYRPHGTCCSGTGVRLRRFFQEVKECRTVASREAS